MGGKITLYSDQHLIDEVKTFAKENHTSVSKLVNNFFKTLVVKNKKYAQDTKITQGLYGALRGTVLEKDDYKKHLEDKYL